MGVEPCEKGKIVSSRGRLMRFTLLQNSISVWFDQFADGGQPLLRRTFGPIGQGHAVKCRDKTVGTFHMLGLVLQQSGAGLIVKPLHEPDIHVRNIVQRPTRLRKYEVLPLKRCPGQGDRCLDVSHLSQLRVFIDPRIVVEPALAETHDPHPIAVQLSQVSEAGRSSLPCQTIQIGYQKNPEPPQSRVPQQR